jgi:hypothetical protein
MPSQVDLPAAFGNAAVEDIDRFQKLPFYLAKNEVAQFPRWKIYDQLFGSIKWQPNQGPVLRGVTPQPSPVVNPLVFPRDITQVPNKNVHSITESIEEATVKLHRFESMQFNFVPYFISFWRDHVKYADDDLVRQISVFNEHFIRTNLWARAPQVYLAGTGIVDAPNQPLESTLSADGTKNKSWFNAQTNSVKSNLNLRTVFKAQLALREDLGAPPFERTYNMPKENEGIKGKYVLVGSTEAFDLFLYDPDTNLLKSIDLNLLFDGFMGSLFGKVTYKFDPFPLRFDAQGNAVAPQIYNETTKKCVPNPAYNNLSSAPYEVAFLVGADAAKTIAVGPPPSEFAQQKISAQKFFSLNWNGKVNITDQVLIQYPDGSVDLNIYGTQLKLYAQVAVGYLAGEPRYCLPIIFRRARPQEV